MIRAIPWFLGLSVLACGTVEAKTYRWVNEQGVVTYSDQPPLVRPVEGERDALIVEALELSGTRKALDSVPAQIKLQLEPRQTALKPPDKARATKILADAFRPEVLYGAVRDAFRSGGTSIPTPTISFDTRSLRKRRQTMRRSSSVLYAIARGP